MIFALCTSLRQATTEQLADPEYCKQFVGADWIPIFMKKMHELGYYVLSGNTFIGPKGWNKGDTINGGSLFVIQEDRTPEGRALLKRGAKGHTLMCLESPMYVPSFYDQYDRIAAQYTHSVTFMQHTAFPSFSQTDTSMPIRQWNLRKPICAILSNKHYSQQRVKLHRSRSPSWKMAIESQLHDARYQVIAALKGESYLDLFGHGWPPGLAHPVANKIAVMRNYKYALVFENIRMPGYCTEKIIHALVAGCIPIYYGDPEIHRRIPADLFIDYSAFAGVADLLSYLEDLSPISAIRKIRAAQEWLRSEEGKRYSYEGFAERMVELATH